MGGPPPQSASSGLPHPWKITIRKGYILPSCRFDDSIDIELICKQLQSHMKSNDSGLDPEDAKKVEALMKANDKAGAVKAALDWPLYFYQSFSCQVFLQINM